MSMQSLQLMSPVNIVVLISIGKPVKVSIQSFCSNIIYKQIAEMLLMLLLTLFVINVVINVILLVLDITENFDHEWKLMGFQWIRFTNQWKLLNPSIVTKINDKKAEEVRCKVTENAIVHKCTTVSNCRSELCKIDLHFVLLLLLLLMGAVN